MSTPGLSSVIRQFMPGVCLNKASTAGAGTMICASADVRTENGRAAVNLNVSERDAATLKFRAPAAECVGGTSASMPAD